MWCIMPNHNIYNLSVAGLMWCIMPNHHIYNLSVAGLMSCIMPNHNIYNLSVAGLMWCIMPNHHMYNLSVAGLMWCIMPNHHIYNLSVAGLMWCIMPNHHIYSLSVAGLMWCILPNHHIYNLSVVGLIWCIMPKHPYIQLLCMYYTKIQKKIINTNIVLGWQRGRLWPVGSVVDYGPALTQYWDSIPCLLGAFCILYTVSSPFLLCGIIWWFYVDSMLAQLLGHYCTRWINPSKHDSRRLSNVGLLLGQRRGRWANSKPTLDQRLESCLLGL